MNVIVLCFLVYFDFDDNLRDWVLLLNVLSGWEFFYGCIEMVGIGLCDDVFGGGK